jgi:MFS transporter, DHA1 family, multidrug resistance protein
MRVFSQAKLLPFGGRGLYSAAHSSLAIALDPDFFMSSAVSKASFVEFVALLAFCMSLVGLSIDGILPALPEIAHHFAITRANTEQFVITALFAGLAAGQLLAGPISDSFGRKRAIYAGLALFVAGCAVAYFAPCFEIFLLGRFMQGLGTAGPRVVTVAIVRDKYEGRDMARVMSIIMACFVVVPAIAPAIGQAVMLFVGWKMVFVLFSVIAAGLYVWILLRLEETLKPEDVRKFDLSTILGGIAQVCRNKICMSYTVCSGLMFGAFMGYLNSAQLIFQVHYVVGEMFPLYFAVGAITIGLASVTNALFVKKFGMRAVILRALIAMAVFAAVFIVLEVGLAGAVPLALFLSYIALSAFCMGLLFGNFNALAMGPMGHLAGMASAVIGCLSLVVAMAAGGIIGQLYNGSLFPVSFGFLGLAIVSLLLMRVAERP